MSLPAFDPWGVLAKIRGGAPAAKLANAANPPPPPEPQLAALAGLAGGGAAAPTAAGAGFLTRFVTEAAECLTEFDQELLAERDAQVAEARGVFGRPLPEAQHRQYLHALLNVSRQRPPAWADQSSRPGNGAYCNVCGSRSWWAVERPNMDGNGLEAGWRCSTCQPPPSSVASLIEET
jgi:hypothetical protein